MSQIDKPILVVKSVLYARKLQKILPNMRVMSFRSSLSGFRTNLMLIDDTLFLNQTEEQERNTLDKVKPRIGSSGAMLYVDVDSLVTNNA